MGALLPQRFTANNPANGDIGKIEERPDEKWDWYITAIFSTPPPVRTIETGISTTLDAAKAAAGAILKHRGLATVEWAAQQG